jgi:RNA polymerase sigma-70 factor (ECF subfamily)
MRPETHPKRGLEIDQLYQRHAAFVGRVIHRFTGEGAHVDDLLQETFIVAFKKLGQFEGRSSAETWLYGIARNLCHRHLRGQRRRLLFQGRYASRSVEEPPPLPGEELERRQAVARVQRVLGRLPFKQREVVVLYELEGREGQEIADLIGVPVGTVWTRLHQARKDIGKLMRRELAKERS